MATVVNHMKKSCSKYRRLSIAFNSNRLFSEIQDYDDASSSYDSMRRAVAVDKVDTTLQLMYARNYVPVSSQFNRQTLSALGDEYKFEHFKSDLHVFDAGCGTGNYIKALYELGVGSIYGMDISDGMLSKCVEKFQNIQTQILNSQSIRLYPGDLNETFPFKSNTFDVLLLNQVLHHVVNNVEDADLENIENVLKNCCDLLNKEGALIITTSTPMQLKYGYWFAQFFPRAINEMIEKHAELEWWYTTLRNCGFDEIHSCKITDFHATSDYLDIAGIFDAEWRKCDSLFGLVTDSELKNAKKRIENILENEEIKEEFLNECQESRTKVGHSVVLIAFKQ